jgi:hypothetical protein
MINRRRLLIGGVGLAVLAAVGIFAGDLATEGEIASGIRRRLPFLHFDSAGLHAFAKDYIDSMLKKRPSWYRWKYHFHSLFSKAAARWGMSTDRRSRRERLEDFFATMYLLSSDFFVTGADPSRVVKYVALYDPMRACNNPFARSALDPQSVG